MDVVTLGAALNGSKKYTDTVAQSLMGGVRYRGEVDYYADLPSNPEEGDAYTVRYSGTSGTDLDGTEYTWGLNHQTQQYTWIDFSKDSYTKTETNNLLVGKQGVIDSTHKLSADLVDDTTSTNKFVTAADKTAWNGKQDAISDLSTIRSNATAGAEAAEAVTGIDETGNNYIELKSGVREYLSTTVPTGTIPTGSVGMGFDEGVFTYKSGTKVSEGEPTANLTDTRNFVNSTTDTRDYFQARLFSGQVVSNQKIDSTGRKNLSIVLPAGEHTLRLRHLGANTDINILTYSVVLTKETAFNCSFDVVGYNPSTVGGLALDNIMLNEGSTPLPYEPYGAKKFPFYANGQNLTDYTIYGNDGGVGDRTANLFDYTKTDDIIANSFINQSGVIVTNDEYYISYPIEVNVGETYTWRFNTDTGNSHTTPTVGFYDSSDNLLSTAQHDPLIRYFSFEVPTNCAYIRASVFTKDKNVQQEAMLNEGDTALPYEPYGYKIPVICGGQTTNIYLDSPLGANDSIDYTTSQVAIPTTDGENTFICDTSVQPSKVSLTYTGWHSDLDDTTARLSDIQNTIGNINAVLEEVL